MWCRETWELKTPTVQRFLHSEVVFLSLWPDGRRYKERPLFDFRLNSRFFNLFFVLSVFSIQPEQFVAFILTALLLVFSIYFIFFYRVTPLLIPAATPWRLRAVAAPPCLCGGRAKTPTLCSAGRRATKAPRSTPANGPWCRTTWWTPERYNKSTLVFVRPKRKLCLH